MMRKPRNFNRMGNGGNNKRNFNQRRGRRFNNRPRGNMFEGKTKQQALQMREKFQNMSRDAQMSGDRVQMEYYLQHVEHYTRIVDYFEAIEREEAENTDDGEEMGDDAAEAMDQDFVEEKPSRREERYARPSRDQEREPADRDAGQEQEDNTAAAMGLTLPPAIPVPSFRRRDTEESSSDEADSAGSSPRRSRSPYGTRRGSASRSESTDTAAETGSPNASSGDEAQETPRRRTPRRPAE